VKPNPPENRNRKLVAPSTCEVTPAKRLLFRIFSHRQLQNKPVPPSAGRVAHEAVGWCRHFGRGRCIATVSRFSIRRKPPGFRGTPLVLRKKNRRFRACSTWPLSRSLGKDQGRAIEQEGPPVWRVGPPRTTFTPYYPDPTLRLRFSTRAAGNWRSARDQEGRAGGAKYFFFSLLSLCP